MKNTQDVRHGRFKVGASAPIEQVLAPDTAPVMKT